MKVTPLIRNFGKYQPGDEFEFPDKAAAIFIKARKLRAVVEASPVKAKRQYIRRDMRAED